MKNEKELALESLEAAETVEEVRTIADQFGVTYSGNSGMKSLKNKLTAFFEENADEDEEEAQDLESLLLGDDDDALEEIEVAKAAPAGPSIEELMKMDPNKVTDTNLRRLVVRTQKLRLVRISIQNLDPAEAQIPGAVLTVHNKYTGKVAKYIPYGEAGQVGYHVPKILFDELKNKKFLLRREKKGRFGVKTYETIMVNKFAITELPPLTAQERKDLAASQQATNALS